MNSNPGVDENTPSCTSRPKRTYRTLLIVVRKLVYKNCPTCVSHRKEDLVQLTIERLLKRIKADGQELTDYNFSFIRNLVYFVIADEVRRELRRPRSSDPSVIELTGVQASSPLLSKRHRCPEEDAIGKDTVEQALRCLDELSQNRKRAVMLKCVQGHSYNEIERITSWPRRTIQNLVHRGRKDLAVLLSKQGLVPGATEGGYE